MPENIDEHKHVNLTVDDVLTKKVADLCLLETTIRNSARTTKRRMAKRGMYMAQSKIDWHARLAVRHIRAIRDEAEDYLDKLAERGS